MFILPLNVLRCRRANKGQPGGSDRGGPAAVYIRSMAASSVEAEEAARPK